jgi:hypothetical protein
MECRQTRGGEWGEVTPSFWRDHLTIAIVDGQARVIPLKALSPGNYEYRLSEVAVRRAFARQPPTDTAPAISSATWIENAVEERRAAGKTYPNITALSVELSKAMEVDPQANPLKPRTIENRLREWGLWPLQGAQARTNGPVRTPAR